MNSHDLISATEYMWGQGAKIYDTEIDGIWNTDTDRHGGFLVDINIHPELSKYGDKTNISNIRAFEEDYEALKVLWVYPKLINNPEAAKEWLTVDNVIKFDKNDDFIKDFPISDLYKEEVESEESL